MQNGRIDFAEPTTAQQARVARIIGAATTMLGERGEADLHMKELAGRAEVSLTTLYRYFPSKDLLLVALGLSRYRVALRYVQTGINVTGETPGQRAASVLLREFAVAQREPAVAAALSRVSSENSPELRGALEEIQGIHAQIVTTAASSGGSALSDEARLIIPLLIRVFSSGVRAWMSRLREEQEVRFDISFACQMLDLPPAELASKIAIAQQLATRPAQDQTQETSGAREPEQTAVRRSRAARD